MHHPLKLSLENFECGPATFQLFVPDAMQLKRQYELSKNENNPPDFPYWARLWPAAEALAAFILQQPHWTEHKRVLELAAGLGLPSFACTAYAAQVCCSDYLPDAVATMQQSIEYNRYKNISTRLLNWNQLPPDLSCDVLLMSDVNYEPAAFDVLFTVFKKFLESGTTILLSSPQRLMAKPFIEQLLPWCVLQHNVEVRHTGVSIYVLQPLNSTSI